MELRPQGSIFWKLSKLIKIENQKALNSYYRLKKFGLDCKKHKEDFIKIIDNLDGKICGYGASARSSTLLNFSQIDHKKINLFVLRTPRISGNYFLIPFKIITVFLLVIKSIFILKIKKIDIILSMGGYAPVPICIAGLILRKKIFIYEPNQVLGNSKMVKFILRLMKILGVIIFL